MNQQPHPKQVGVNRTNDGCSVAFADHQIEEATFVPTHSSTQIKESASNITSKHKQAFFGVKIALCILLAIMIAHLIFIAAQKYQIKTAMQSATVNTNPQQQASKEIQQKEIKERINLWQMLPSEKMEMLRKFQLFKLNNTNQAHLQNMIILSHPNEQTQQFFKQFEQNSQEIKWSEFSMSDESRLKFDQFFVRSLRIKQKEDEFYLKKYRLYKNNKQLLYPKNNITINKAQLFNAIQYLKITGRPKDNKAQQLSNRYKSYLQSKYAISTYKNELRACVIVPTYNNAKSSRYLWNIHSILQQEYENYKVIIIDDASNDETSKRIGMFLRWANPPKDKFILIKTLKRNKSLHNFYYAAHKYCGLGEILYTIDGDDQLIGTHVFKLINAIYQTEKVYTLYTTYINKSYKMIRLGYNQNYRSNTKQSNAFRRDKSHAYSHLRTMLSDTFLLVDNSSLMDGDGKFYESTTDNAVYFCALQLSCGRIKFLQEITYLYNFGTESNIITHTNSTKYNKTMEDVSNKKPYRCIENYFEEALQWYHSAYPS